MIDTTIINLQRQNIGATLKQARLNAGLTYYALAKQAGLKLHQIQSIEAGTKAYTIDSYLRIAAVLGINAP
ncbi:MAG TPA: helix-turn-helix transcriptional regulator [Bacteroidia bacterium]|nr:helix-turn-helix transcriptional regulator [Bacteroidia bacterium]